MGVKRSANHVLPDPVRYAVKGRRAAALEAAVLVSSFPVRIGKEPRLSALRPCQATAA
jgi:hypothetical protein